MIKKINFFIKKNNTLLFTLLFNLYIIYNVKSQTTSGSYETLLLVLFLCVISNCILFIIIKKIPYFQKSVTKIFLLIAIPVGFLYIFFIPVFAGTDEPLHFFRAYQISVGETLIDSDNPKAKIPQSVLNLHYRRIKENYQPFRGFEKLEKSNKVLLPLKDSANQYSPIQYLPQIIGIKIGEIINLSPMLIVILSRILIFITWCVIIFFAYNEFRSIKYEKKINKINFE